MNLSSVTPTRRYFEKCDCGFVSIQQKLMGSVLQNILFCIRQKNSFGMT